MHISVAELSGFLKKCIPEMAQKQDVPWGQKHVLQVHYES